MSAGRHQAPPELGVPERSWLSGAPDAVARRLLGMLLVRDDGRALRLVEVEAYGGVDDPASHAQRGRTARNATMWGPAGHLYVYRSYGVHWCANVTCGDDGNAAAVLLRAGEPAGGLDGLRAARWSGRSPGPDRDLARGPGRLGAAMGFDAGDDGADLIAGDRGIRLLASRRARLLPGEVVAAPRVGISRALEARWRFFVEGSPAVSLPRPARPAGERQGLSRAGGDPVG